MLQLIKEDTLAPDDEDTPLTVSLKASIIKILDEKYAALPEASVDLLRKATFMDPRYRGDYDANVDETKVKIKEEAVIHGQRDAVIGGEEGEVGEEGAASQQQQPKRKKTLASLFKRKAGAAATITPATTIEKVVAEMANYCQESPLDAEEDPLLWWKKK